MPAAAEGFSWPQGEWASEGVVVVVVGVVVADVLIKENLFVHVPQHMTVVSFIESPFPTRTAYRAYLELPPDRQAVALEAAAKREPGIAASVEAAAKREPVIAASVAGRGRGLIAQRDLVADEQVLAVPFDDVWPTAAEVRPQDDWAEDLSDEACLALWLLRESSLAEAPPPIRASPHASAISELPQQLDTVLQWSDAEVGELRGSCFFQMAEGFRDETAYEHQLAKNYKATDADYATFAWAKAVFTSRQVELEVESNRVEARVVPKFDLLNHGGPAACCRFAAEQSGVVVRASRGVGEGEEVTISYGTLGNGSLLIFHGFVVSPNPYDTVEIVLTLPPLDPARVLLIRALEAAAEAANEEEASAEPDGVLSPYQVVADEVDKGGELAVRHNLTAARPLPLTLLATFRILKLSTAELAGKQVNALLAPAHSLADAAPDGEILAMRTCEATLKCYLANHTTSTEQDRATLASGVLPARTRMAITVRLAEKEILQSAVDGMRVC